MMVLIEAIGDKLKKIGAIKRLGWLRVPLRNLAVCVARLVHPGGVSKNIGETGIYKMDSEFTFCNYASWGKGHNSGFLKMMDLSRSKTVVFDIGAHIGLCALPMSRILGEGGVCLAFEPSEGNLRYLNRHIALNEISNIKVVPYMVGEETKDAVPFFESEGECGMNSIKEYTHGCYRYKKVFKRQVSIDDYVGESGHAPDFIKMDVEGAEIDVLRGARQTLLSFRPPVIISVHPKQLKNDGNRLGDLLDLIKALKYRITNIDGTLIAGELDAREYYLTYDGSQA